MSNTRLLNISSLASQLDIDRSTVYEWLHSEQLPKPAKIINRRRYWTEGQIDEFLKVNSK